VSPRALSNAARHLFERDRVALVMNWREKSQAREQVRLAIEDTVE